MLDWKSLLYTDKPMSLSVKNFLIRKISTTTMISEKTITSVIDHQFTSLLENMSIANSLEISGFGKFLFNKNKAIIMMQKYIKGLENFKNELVVCTDTKEIKRIEFRISNLELRMKALNQKLQSYENQFRSNI
jgi:hypothetical protein